METFRLKNIIIFILVLVNIFLLGTLGLRQSQEYAARRQASDELVALFASDGVTLSEGAITFAPPPATLTLSRDTLAEKAMTATLLGSALVSVDEGGGILTFSSDTGHAVFRISGEFEIAGALGSSPAALVENFCKDNGSERPSDSSDAWLDASGSGTAIVPQFYQGHPVKDCSFTFLAEKGELLSVSGTFLPPSFVVADGGAPLSASTALTTFLEARRVSGAVISAVTELYPCYEFQSASSSMTLTPIWCIVTDTVNYYVNSMTGAVSHD